MDRRSWLWRRKSSEKSPGETESSGSLSSHSERFSDDQATATYSSQSLEITSKALNVDEEVSANVKTVTERLSAALLNISAKEELVKQHAKVAEEAVSGWEKAEKEVLALKQQLEAAHRKNSALEDRVGHLDGALKECVRQLRQVREEQDEKIQESIKKKTNELESKKSELETQVAELQAQIQLAKSDATASIHEDLRPKLDALEKENSKLKLELLSQAEELEIRTIERDVSNQAAETASKQLLDNIKKLTKLEAECRKLKAMAQKSPPSKDYKSHVVTSNYFESLSDSQSDSGERLMVLKNDTRKMHSLEMSESEPSPSKKVVGKKLRSPSAEINLMDDFLEMERLAALPDAEVEYLGSGTASDKLNGRESQLIHELETSIDRITELEERLEMAEVEKLQLEMALMESKEQIELLQNQIKETEVKLSELKKIEAGKLELEMTLARSQKQHEELRSQLDKAEGKLSEFEKIKAEKLELAICLTGTKQQLEKSKNQLREAEGKFTELQAQLGVATDAKRAAENEVKAANMRRDMAESRLRDVEGEIASLSSKIASLEEDAEKERALSAKHLAKCEELHGEILKLKDEVEHRPEAALQHMHSFDGDSKVKQEKELAVAASKFSECQKTIASLSQQLKSLATLEDFLLESEDLLDLNSQEFQQNVNPGELKFSKRDSGPLNVVENCSSSLKNGSDTELLFPLTPVISSERSQNGFGKFLSRNKNGRPM